MEFTVCDNLASNFCSHLLHGDILKLLLPQVCSLKIRPDRFCFEVRVDNGNLHGVLHDPHYPEGRR
jgi:hypothetical protein